jgi:hypothetical protein
MPLLKSAKREAPRAGSTQPDKGLQQISIHVSTNIFIPDLMYAQQLCHPYTKELRKGRVKDKNEKELGKYGNNTNMYTYIYIIYI